MVAVVKVDHLTHVGLVDHLSTIANSATSDEPGRKLVVEGLPYSDAMVEELHVERGDHVLPVIIVGRKEYDGLSLLVIAVDELAVDEAVAALDGWRCGEKVVNEFDGYVGQMAVILSFYLTALGIVFFRKRRSKVSPRHLLAVAHKIVNNKIDYIS